MNTASLSFALRPATTWDHLLQAAQVRSMSYGHHVPGMRSLLAEPDDVDLLPSTVVLICTDKNTGRPVGTARIQVSTRGTPLISECVKMPAEMQDDSFAEITRLASVPGADPLVKLALMKAGYLYCLANQARWLVIGARNDALIRQYGRLGFSDVFESQQMVVLSYAAGMPHRILRFDVTAAERVWAQNKHPLYPFMVETVHKDIQLFLPAAIERQAQRVAA